MKSPRPSPALKFSCLTVLPLLLSLALLAATCSANTEIVNFGPLLCRDDPEGRDELYAAAKLAQDWPTLDITRPGGLFSIELSGPSPLLKASDSRTGAWIKLKLARPIEGGPVARHRPANPRDRFLQKVWHSILWALTQRFTVRASIAANHATDTRLRVMNAHEMLVAGNLRRVAQDGSSSPDDRASTDAPIVKIGNAPSLEQTAVPYKDVLEEGRYLARQVQEAELREELERFPCQVAYLQVVAMHNAISVPERQECLSFSGGASSRFWQSVRRLYFDRLAWDSGRPCSASDVEHAPKTTSEGVQISSDEGGGMQAPQVAPIALTFEQLHLGVLPTTAAYLVCTLVITLALVRVILAPVARLYVSHAVATARQDVVSHRAKIE
ncbi:hypothetical protein K437DRAFT_72967 [Tilletiaria anomala UBC 951]|uniref:Protein BIG1 n=1 Tax=Tilletiaria anomala (strain ATCC 24038 / CBS 436.72 / UBC 951) TaxID=1037660 RepID=A0A066WBK2_TILAU|nr:uncharacterized protein K437DRAFT_72967 [Tilletiaria anomala UBC 951]KDN49898.1 hypothetical protein K437DRAFT_72967 [Tilletiaria anomala UBC 951]